MIFFKREKIKDAPPPDWMPAGLASALAEEGYTPHEAVIVRQNSRARRLSLRADVKKRRIVLTLPRSATWLQAREFAQQQQRWILRHLTEIAEQSVVIGAGEYVPVLGVPRKIVPTGKLRGAVRCEGDYLYVSGAPEHHARRVRDYLRGEARREISWRAREKADRIGKKITRIRIGDPHSRWGSCSARGVLSFSWRLYMAPQEMLDYVVAHEVAHLQHMDHSRAFWSLCQELTESDVSKCRKWFKMEGAKLFSYYGGVS